MYVVFLQLQDKYSSSYLNLWGGKGKEEPGELKHGVYGNMQHRAVGATTTGTVMAILLCLSYVYHVSLLCLCGLQCCHSKEAHKTKSRFKVLNMQKGVTFITLFRGEVKGAHIPLDGILRASSLWNMYGQVFFIYLLVQQLYQQLILLLIFYYSG